MWKPIKSRSADVEQEHGLKVASAEGDAASPSLTALDTGALVELLRALKRADYDFVTPNQRVVAANRRWRAAQPRTLRDVFGWSLDFAAQDLPADIMDLALRAGVLEEAQGRWRSQIRVSTVQGCLLAHSAYPTRSQDSVFLGPDSYRFARFILQTPIATPPRSIVDIGTGAGVGALVAGQRFKAARLVGTDLNAAALGLAAANAQAAGRPLETVLCSGLGGVEGEVDLIVANPPFISGRKGRTYRDGGDMRGLEVSLEWAREGVDRLSPGGTMLLYTASPIVRGHDEFAQALRQSVLAANCRLDYQEIDPDVFSELLGKGDYEDVERVAAIGAIVRRPA